MPGIHEIGIMIRVIDDNEKKIMFDVCICSMKDYCKYVEKGKNLSS